MLEDAPAGATPTQRFARSAAGTLLAAALLGVRDALEGRPEEEPAVIDAWAGEPFGPERILMRLDPDDPADSIVWIRAPRTPADLW